MHLEDRRTRIKICGITTLEDARFASGALADFLGFIFVPDTPRYVPPETAAEMIQWVEGPKCVGVFMNETPGKINAIALQCGLDMVQLHGEETPEDCAAITLPVMKAFRIRPEMNTADLHAMMKPYERVADYFLLDAWHKDKAGGTGERFNWEVIGDLTERYPIMLAGGLNPDNVRGAVEQVGPFGLDVSSGVEQSPGVKDFELIIDLMEEMREIWEEQELGEL